MINRRFFELTSFAFVVTVSWACSHASAAEISRYPSLFGEFSNLVHRTQVTGPSIGTGDIGSPLSDPGGKGGSGEPPASSAVTSRVSHLISQAALVCGGIPDAYTIDCLAKEIMNAANTLPDNHIYREAKGILHQAATDLHGLVRANVDDAQPRVRVQLPNGSDRRVTRPISAVRPEKIEQAKEKALDIINSAETVLLRSANTSGTRAAAYLRISQAIGSNKVLLRS